jgi:hypothetical protein
VALFSLVKKDGNDRNVLSDSAQAKPLKTLAERETMIILPTDEGEVGCYRVELLQQYFRTRHP